jgi:ABC-type protease/lipase transport system fused ATPase/permease subunit
MDKNRIIERLGQRVRKQAGLNLLGGGLSLLGALAVLAATWGLIYVVSLFALGPWLGHRHWIHATLGWVVIPALFWGNARTSREYLSEYSVNVGTTSETVVNFYLPGLGMGSNVNPLGPETMHAVVKMITDCLYSGPRLAESGFRTLSKANRMRRLDAQACGLVIAALLASNRKLAFQEIVNQAGMVDPARVFPQLRDIEGVLFLQADPAGLSLSQELRRGLLHHD